MSQQITTSKVRLSYVNVFTPRANQQGVEKYSVTCLLPKTDTAGYNQLMAAIKAEYEAEKDGKLKGVATPKHPIWDGDGVTSTGAEFGPECKGCWVFTASANPEYPPAVVDQNVQPILKQTDVYSGCYGHVALSIYAYNNQSKGIGFGLNGVQKVADGEPLGHSFSAKDAFHTVPKQPGGEIDPLTGLPVEDTRIPF
ncbi:MAG: DUF2815 family protein [Peptoniphilaceae bacterium]|nr:DUF2815 family protein [Peptoniphilaceae bacterium]MDY4197162.1 DUF2815 family protein [Peptoniphilaceae bacterium]MDY5841626.1 DUF2815 family protein [Peptoniphilaceae bacterium]